MLEKLEAKIESLNEMLKLYSDLNRKTKGKYNWREQAIEAQIEVLEQLRDNEQNNWLECYEEDLKESKELIK